MCYFCYAQLFEITHLTNIKSTLVQHSCRNAEVVEAFCRVAASRSNTRRSIHQPSVAALHAPAEMPTALSSILRYQTLHVASCPRRAYHRERPALNPHSARCLAGAQLPATSCLGAFRPPATSSCGGSRDPGVRKPAHFRKWPGSFDHLIGAANQCEGRLYAKRLQRLQIYEELHFCRKLNGQIGWLFAA